MHRGSIKVCAVTPAPPPAPEGPAEPPTLHWGFLPRAWAVAVRWQLGWGAPSPGQGSLSNQPGTKVDGQESLEPESSATWASGGHRGVAGFGDG